MLGGRPRLAARAHQHTALAGLAALSLSLHMTLFLCWLMIPSTQEPTAEPEPPSVDFIADEGPKAASPGPPALTDAPAAPLAPAAFGENAETPSPAPDAPSSPLVQEAEPPPPPEPTPAPDAPRAPPAQPAEMTPPPVSAPTPDAPPPVPVEEAEMTRSTQAPALTAELLTPLQFVQARPLWGRAQDWRNAAASRTSQANNGAAWMAKLEKWRDQHAFDLRDASQTNAGGDVKIRMSIAADGQVTSIRIVQGSGSSALDAAAVTVFRNAHLPPFPPDAPAQPADVVMTLHYRPSGAGG